MIKYLVMDIDGSLTDGKIYMGPSGEAMKAFSIKDGMVPNFYLKPAGIIPVVITARESTIVENRCKEIGITEVYQGKLDKLSVLKEIVGTDGLGSCAYFGDDTLDLKCIIPIREAGGIGGCPCDAVQEVKAACNYISEHKAGEGALREFTEWLLSFHEDSDDLKSRVDRALSYMKKLNVVGADCGKKVVVDDKFFYTVQSYQTKSEEDAGLESHKEYIDIQLMISGNEVMDICDTSRLSVKTPYDLEKDIMFWNIPPRMARITLKTGDFIILYPENAHRGAVKLDQAEHVVKIVGKVKI
jgi:YrbI family 3-deoxy-D-manno-octulosonate 8-phosphate phosphatase/YhcH/YjgK/YiaL family protein